jgi:hypothetical protein
MLPGVSGCLNIKSIKIGSRRVKRKQDIQDKNRKCFYVKGTGRGGRRGRYSELDSHGHQE